MNSMLVTLQDSRRFLATVSMGDSGLCPDASLKCVAADAECTGVCVMLAEAWAAVEQMDGALLDDAQTFSFCDTSDSGEAWCDTETRFPESAIDFAAGSSRIYEVYLGLMTVRGLIEISQSTLRRSPLSGDAKEEAWLALARESRSAGRAAYASVLRLADPHADLYSHLPESSEIAQRAPIANWPPAAPVTYN